MQDTVKSNQGELEMDVLLASETLIGLNNGNLYMHIVRETSL